MGQGNGFSSVDSWLDSLGLSQYRDALSLDYS